MPRQSGLTTTFRDFSEIDYDITRTIPTKDTKMVIYYMESPIWLPCAICSENATKVTSPFIYKVHYDIPRCNKYVFPLGIICSQCATDDATAVELTKRMPLYRAVKERELELMGQITDAVVDSLDNLTKSEKIIERASQLVDLWRLLPQELKGNPDLAALRKAIGKIYKVL